VQLQRAVTNKAKKKKKGGELTDSKGEKKGQRITNWN